MNFLSKVRKAAWERSGEKCEGALPNGDRCGCDEGPFIFDHVVPDYHGGRPTIENCQVLCKDCDRAKTAADRAAIDDTRRAYDAHRRLRAPRKIIPGSLCTPVKRGFDGQPRERATGRPLSRPASIDVRDL